MEALQIRENISLRPYNTFGIDVPVQYFAPFATEDDLLHLVQYCKRQKLENLLVLGGGSNVLFTKPYRGLVAKNELEGIAVKEEGDAVYVTAGAGVNWHALVLFCLDNGYAGLENLALIPGSVGASPMQNIGAYGVEIKDVFHSLQAVHIQEERADKFSSDDCNFGYRESVFKKELKGQYIITSVTYQLSKTPHFNTSYGAIRQELDRMGVEELSIKAVAQAVMNIRSSKLPDWKQIGNAGSFFKNPQVPLTDFENLQQKFPTIIGYPQGKGVKLAAGWLIEQCGWKGYRKGDAGCYPKQALVLVNYGTATGAEMFELSEQVIQSVQQKFGVVLEREVNVV